MINREEWQSAVKNHACGQDMGLMHALELYLFDRMEPGGFLRAVLENRFHEALGLAHRLMTVNHLRELSEFVQNFLPASAHGNPSIVAHWLKENHD